MTELHYGTRSRLGFWFEALFFATMALAFLAALILMVANAGPF